MSVVTISNTNKGVTDKQTMSGKPSRKDLVTLVAKYHLRKDLINLAAEYPLIEESYYLTRNDFFII